MLETTDAVAAERAAVSIDVAAALRALNPHRAMPGPELLRGCADALRLGHRLEADAAPAPLRRLLKRFGARALEFKPDVHVYELAVLWELGETPPDRLEERLKQRGVRRLYFDRGDAGSHLAAACAALELSLEEADPRLKQVLLKIALDNAQRAKSIYPGRAAGIPAKPPR